MLTVQGVTDFLDGLEMAMPPTTTTPTGEDERGEAAEAHPSNTRRRSSPGRWTNGRLKGWG